MQSERNPYQTPKIEDHPAGNYRTFRISVFRPWIWISTVSLVVSSIVLHYLASGGLSSLLLQAPRSIVPGPLIIFLAAAASIIWMMPCYCIKMHDSGINGPDFSGTLRIVGWDRIHSGQRRNFMGFPYLLIRSDVSARPLWLPLYLTNESKFWQFLNWNISPNVLVLAQAAPWSPTKSEQHAD